ncbi:MAG: ParA family protein [Anaerolineales bacterium]|nr:ParA family protein [Anaerolineales bacterium]
MNTIAITNQKGGVGKTTTTAALGAVLANQGWNVLLVDLDPQASLTQMFGVYADGKSLAEVLGGAQEGILTLKDIIQPVRDCLSLAPSHLRLSASELGLVQRWGRETLLRNALESLVGYDVVLIDCPPSIGMLTANGVVAAQGVIVPSLPSEADLWGVNLFLNTLNRVRSERLNSDIDLLGILVVQFDGRTKEHNRLLEVLDTAEHPVLGVIPRSVKAQEAVTAKMPVTEYNPNCKPSLAYFEVAEKVIAWLHHNNRSEAFLRDLRVSETSAN